MRAQTQFDSAVHGYPFANHFDEGTFVVDRWTPFGRLRLGNVSGGVCGGMVHSALDAFHDGRVLPSEPDSNLLRRFCRRLLASWNLPFGVLRYYFWQCRPGASKLWNGVRILDGVTRLTVTEEWPKIRRQLDAGHPVPLGVVQVDSYDPRLMPRHHQTLATGYQLSEDESFLELAIYDPNFPGVEVRYELPLDEPDREHHVRHSCGGPPIRGFFAVDYRFDGEF